MISFRYYIVSIVAVFLALGLGVLAGTTVLDSTLVQEYKSRTSSLERQLGDVRIQLSTLNGFVNDSVPHLVNGQLSGQQIVLITEEGVDGSAVAAATSFLGQAGASRIATLRVEPGMAARDTGSRDQLAVAIGADPSTPPAELSRLAALGLADRLVTGGSGGSHDLLKQLLSDGLLLGQGFSAKDVPEVGGPSQLIVVVGGGQAKPPVPLQQFLLPLLEQLAHNRMHVAAGEALSVAFPFVGLVRDDGLLDGNGVVTVDDLDQPFGGVALVLGLSQLIRSDQGGDYGVKGGATSVIPRV